MADLLRQFPCQVEGDAFERRVFDEVVEVVGEVLEDEAQVVPELKIPE